MNDRNPQTSYDELHPELIACIQDADRFHDLAARARSHDGGEEALTTLCTALNRLWMVNGDLYRVQDVNSSQETADRVDEVAEQAAEAFGEFQYILLDVLAEWVSLSEALV